MTNKHPRGQQRLTKPRMATRSPWPPLWICRETEAFVLCSYFSLSSQNGRRESWTQAEMVPEDGIGEGFSASLKTESNIAFEDVQDLYAALPSYTRTLLPPAGLSLRAPCTSSSKEKQAGGQGVASVMAKPTTTGQCHWETSLCRFSEEYRVSS